MEENGMSGSVNPRAWAGRIVGILLTLGVLPSLGSAQPRFSIPITVTDGVDSSIVYIAIVPGANFCVVESDSVDGHAEFFLPPMPPSGVFDARLVWPRAGSNATCFDQGTTYDFRPYTSSTQRDTFRIKAQIGSGVAIVVSWPSNLASHFVSATIRYVGGSGAVTMDMLTNTFVDITDAGDPAVATIYTSSPLTDVEPTQSGIPSTYALTQNFPNPFNPTTLIRYDLPKDSHVRIRIFDMLGREVATLVNEMERAGFKSVNWDASRLASGLYFCQLEAASFTSVKKMLLLK
jgi:hypothetical protein